ncbi:MAG: FdtA/QdtA family cupin domain-containing protein [Cytophagaceae bacterium]|jgi:hypothetical protein|nr:FdtA/QdtA family cupin domain-containing protein [Cytophagaceae bacterium]
MDFPKILNFQKIGTRSEGFLSIVNHEVKIPFDIKRVYWLYQVPDGVIRGDHAHKVCKQVLVAIQGSIVVRLENLIGCRYEYELDHPNQGLIVPNMYWSRLEFSPGAICVSLASEDYEETEYIRDYEEFRKLRE